MFRMINIMSGSHHFATFIKPTLPRTSYIPSESRPWTWSIGIFGGLNKNTSDRLID